MAHPAVVTSCPPKCSLRRSLVEFLLRRHRTLGGANWLDERRRSPARCEPAQHRLMSGRKVVPGNPLTLYLGTGFMVIGMRSSQVAARAGVNVQTLRYYERRGCSPNRSAPSPGTAPTRRGRCAPMNYGFRSPSHRTSVALMTRTSMLL